MLKLYTRLLIAISFFGCSALQMLCGQSITTGSINGSPFCAGSSVSVPFTITGSFNTGNIFTVQLSDASGSFANPVVLDTLSSTTAATISTVIPFSTAGGTAYRIRVVSSN